MSIHRLGALAFALCALVLLSFCGSTSSSTSSTTPPNTSFVVDRATAGSALVTPEAGGVVRTAKGDTLIVPPGAVTHNVTITMTPLVLPADGRIDVFGGFVTTPERLSFLVSASLSLVLAQSLEPGLELELAESHDPGIPGSFGPANVLFEVDADGRTATGTVQGFSGKILEKNCHAGTRDKVLEAWSSRPGRDDGSIGRVTGVDVAAFRSCARPGPDPLQTMIAPYFEQCGDLAPGQPFDEPTLDKIAITLASHRQVVFFFGTRMPVDPATGLRRGVDHSAVAIANSDGSVTIRNQINLTNPQTIRELEKAGKSSTLDLPLSDIDKPTGMRALRKGETTAILKGEPFDRSEHPDAAWPHVVVMCETGKEPDAGVPDAAAPDGAAAMLRTIEVIRRTFSQDPNETIAEPLYRRRAMTKWRSGSHRSTRRRSRAPTTACSRPSRTLVRDAVVADRAGAADDGPIIVGEALRDRRDEAVAQDARDRHRDGRALAGLDGEANVLRAERETEARRLERVLCDALAVGANHR